LNFIKGTSNTTEESDQQFCDKDHIDWLAAEVFNKADRAKHKQYGSGHHTDGFTLLKGATDFLRHHCEDCKQYNNANRCTKDITIYEPLGA
jgi:hypothetical protein